MLSFFVLMKFKISTTVSYPNATDNFNYVMFHEISPFLDLIQICLHQKGAFRSSTGNFSPVPEVNRRNLDFSEDQIGADWAEARQFVIRRIAWTTQQPLAA